MRKQKLDDLARYLNTPVVVYAVDCVTPSPKSNLLAQMIGPAATMIEPGDKDALAEVLEHLDGERLTIMVQSPGGLAETAEALVNQMRAQFRTVHFIVPLMAKSAATMLALSGNKIYLDELSELGPIDPQFAIGGIPSPAPAIIRQFRQAVEEIEAHPERLPAWAPILQQYAPSLLAHAEEVWALGRSMVEGWLDRYMFADGGKEHIEGIVRYFSGQDEEDRPGSHARQIGIEKCIDLGLHVEDMRRHPALHKRVRELHHAVNMTLSETGAYKLLENSKGEAYVRGLNVQVNAQAQPPPGPVPPVPGT